MEDSPRTFFTADAQFAVQPPAEGERVTLGGYACVWNAISNDRGGYKVRLLPGSATLQSPLRALYHHEYAAILGTTDNGSLRASVDDVGVRFEIDLPQTTLGRDVHALVRDRYIRGMSFTMAKPPTGRSVVENGQRILDVTSFVVEEITVTPIPSFTGTSVEVKAAAEQFAARTQHDLRLQRARFDLVRQGVLPRAV